MSDSSSFANCVASLIGFIFLAKIILTTVWDVIVGVRAHLWSRLWDKNLVQKYGKWAVITGCTDGIGKAYAIELARNGMNLILISRTMKKLENMADAIVRKYGVQTEVIQADFSVGEQVYPEIEKCLKGKEIGILVNNVGVITPYPMTFGEVDDSQLWSHVNVNVASPMAMTKIVLPQMLRRNKGAIVNFASVAGRFPCPLLQVYSASKAFVDYFSAAIGVEYATSGITIQTVTPSYVSTNMTSYSEKIHTPSLFIPTPAIFAASALHTLGYTNYTTGYWSHGILAWMIDNFLLRSVAMRLVKRNHEVLLLDMKKNQTNKNK